MGKGKRYRNNQDLRNFVWLFTAVILFYFFWLSLLLGGVFLTIVLTVWIHRFIKNLWWYKSPFVWAILSYMFLLMGLYLGWNTLITKVPEINDTFIQRSEKISTYISIGSNKKWQPILQPNEQGIILENLSNITTTWQIQ